MGPKEDAQGTSRHRPIPHPSPVILGWPAQAQASRCWGAGASRRSPTGRLSWAPLEAGALVRSAGPETEGSGAHLSGGRRLGAGPGDRDDVADGRDERRGSLERSPPRLPAGLRLLPHHVLSSSAGPIAPFEGGRSASLNPLLSSPRVQLSSEQGHGLKVVDVNFLTSCLLRRGALLRKSTRSGFQSQGWGGGRLLTHWGPFGTSASS